MKQDLIRVNLDLNSNAVKASAIQEYRKAKLELVASSTHLQGYELVQPDQMPTDDLILAAWLIRNQTKALTSPDKTFMDFRAPIEFEALIMPQNLL